MMDFETMTRLDVIYEALKESTERSQIASFSARANRIELALLEWELFHAQKKYDNMDGALNG